MVLAQTLQRFLNNVADTLPNNRRTALRSKLWLSKNEKLHRENVQTWLCQHINSRLLRHDMEGFSKAVYDQDFSYFADSSLERSIFDKISVKSILEEAKELGDGVFQPCWKYLDIICIFVDTVNGRERVASPKCKNDISESSEDNDRVNTFIAGLMDDIEKDFGNNIDLSGMPEINEEEFTNNPQMSMQNVMGQLSSGQNSQNLMSMMTSMSRKVQDAVERGECSKEELMNGMIAYLDKNLQESTGGEMSFSSLMEQQRESGGGMGMIGNLLGNSTVTSGIMSQLLSTGEDDDEFPELDAIDKKIMQQPIVPLSKNARKKKKRHEQKQRQKDAEKTINEQ